MVRAISSALRVAVPLKTRCSIRWETPPRSSGSWREPVSTQIPTATERTWPIRSEMTRIPFGSRLFSYSSVTGRIRRVGVFELLAPAQGRLLTQGDLPAEPHLAVAVDLDDLDGDLVTFAEDVLHAADAGFGDLRDVQQPLRVGDHFHKGAELHDLLDLTHVDAVDFNLPGDVLDHPDGPLDRSRIRREHGDLAVVLDVDLGPGLFLDPPHHLATGADDLADLLGPDLDGDEA